jgi:lysozyme
VKESFNQAQLLADLREDEGYRKQAYVDTVGLTTIGIGRELSHRGLSDQEVMFLYHNDVDACCAIMDQDIPWWRNLAENEQRVMINLCFMGWGSFSGFHNFLAAMKSIASIREGDVSSIDDNAIIQSYLRTAVRELQNSKWWEQVKSRGPRVVARLMGTANAVS